MKIDDGEYTCRLVNAAGETTGYTNLFVRQPVEYVRVLYSLQLRWSSNVNIYIFLFTAVQAVMLVVLNVLHQSTYAIIIFG